MQLETGDFLGDLKRWHKAYMEHITALTYSNNTLELYNRAIDMFIEYSRQYQDEIKLSEINSVYITGYIAFLEDNAKKSGKKRKNDYFLSKSTKQTYLKAVKNFFTFISDNNDDLYTFERRFGKIRIADTSKMEEKLVYLNESEIERLLNTLEREKAKKGDYNSYRNSLLIKLMLYAGLRISEALGVRLGDFTNSEDPEIFNIEIYGKGGKEQTAYIPKATIEEELDYFADAAALGEDDPIMRTGGGGLLNRSNAYRIVNRIYKRAGIRKKGLHLLRHTLAMRLTQRGVNPLVVKKILRHSNIASTTIYAKATENTVADALKADLPAGL